MYTQVPVSADDQQLQHQVTTFHPGDTVLIEYLEKKNGSKGTLLHIKKV